MPSKTLKTTTAAAVLALGLLASQPASAANNTSDSQAFTFGVIGDIPYGDAEIAKFRPASRTSTPTARSSSSPMMLL
ncbi:MAG: hypothetical protein M3536_03035 [Actinomycetota bacterium]|nr:hypothetical protein [Actinomycetota bacterium]